MSLFWSIISFLDEHRVPYRTVHHAPTFTSEESSKVRGEDVRIGGKAIVIKVDHGFKLFVLSAALKVDSKKIKEHFHAKSIRFASKEELLALTGLVPGSVPPFGPPILSIPLYIDHSVQENERIAFNAGSLTDSVIMETKDYLSIIEAEQFSFSAP